MDSRNNFKEYYLGLKIKQINERLTNINPYTEISRYPREISQRAQWKANEWLNWLLYFSNPCLVQILPIQYLNHFQMLQKIIQKLIGNDINVEVIIECRILADSFVKEFQNFYGKKCMVYNVHLLIHMIDSVANFGPLWGFSLFPYENYNGMLKNFIKGPKEPIQQINNKYLMNHQINFGYYSKSCKNSIIEYCKRMISSGSSGNNIKNNTSKYYFSFKGYELKFQFNIQSSHLLSHLIIEKFTLIRYPKLTRGYLKIFTLKN